MGNLIFSPVQAGNPKLDDLLVIKRARGWSAGNKEASRILCHQNKSQLLDESLRAKITDPLTG